MKLKMIFTKRVPHNQTGVTLVELMVSLAIGLVIALAVTMAYVAVRGTATSTDAVSRINEDGKLAMDMIAREIQMAGTYPLAFMQNDPDIEKTANTGRYTNIKSPGTIAYEHGIFGCSAAKFNPVTSLCETSETTAPGQDRDSLVINYFSAASVRDVGTKNPSVSGDCINGDLKNDVLTNVTGKKNNDRFTAGLPMFVSNRFAINTTSYSQASTGSAGADSVKTISTGSLSCNGNGTSTESLTYQPIFEGVTQMVIRYAVTDGTTDTPQRFYTATQVSALADTADGKNGWARVSAVRVCLLMQSLTGGRNQNAAEGTGKEKKYVDCQGTTVTQATSDRNIYKTFTRVIAVRNHLTGVN